VASARTLSGRILDCGGGLGEYLPYLGGGTVVLDRALGPLRSLAAAQRVAGDAERLPFCADAFDNVWCCAVAQYLHLSDLVGEMIRVTRHGGRILILVPNGRSPWDRLKRLLGLPSWWDQEGIVTQYSVEDLARFGRVTGEIQFLPLERLLRHWPRLGHTLMLEVLVSK
jgi:SAM-dependent methyltransferase